MSSTGNQPLGSACLAPIVAAITSYDSSHFLTYALLIEADASGAGWSDAAASILGWDVEADPASARECWASHLKRARWIAKTGYALLKDQAGQHLVSRKFEPFVTDPSFRSYP